MFHFMSLGSTRLCPPPKEAAENAAGTAHCLVEKTVWFLKVG